MNHIPVSIIIIEGAILLLLGVPMVLLYQHLQAKHRNAPDAPRWEVIPLPSGKYAVSWSVPDGTSRYFSIGFYESEEIAQRHADHHNIDRRNPWGFSIWHTGGGWIDDLPSEPPAPSRHSALLNTGRTHTLQPNGKGRSIL